MKEAQQYLRGVLARSGSVLILLLVGCGRTASEVYRKLAGKDR